MSRVKKLTLTVVGTHCNACKHLIEETIAEQPDFVEPEVSLQSGTVTFGTTRTDDPETLASHLNSLLSQHGYSFQKESPSVKKQKPHDWLYATVVVLIVILGFIALEKAGLASLIGSTNATLTTAFLVGLVASVSSCLAVVGALVLSVSATYAHEGKGWRPQVLFHTGRIGGFFVLGGLLGTLGETMKLDLYVSAALGVLASLVMFMLGVQLLDITKRARMLTLPRSISQSFSTAAKQTGIFAPILLGAVTFFLPCGFTQSMQIVALSSGSFTVGASTMLAFALGTLPVLALLSFGSWDLAKSKFRSTFFKAAGLLVILFALFNLHNAMVLFGIISPLISF